MFLLLIGVALVTFDAAMLGACLIVALGIGIGVMGLAWLGEVGLGRLRKEQTDA